MAAPSPIRRGFEAIAREPALPLAEITWRWCFAAAGGFVGAVALLEYLNSISVSWRERLMLESNDPLLALAAVVHALRGSALRFDWGVILAATAIAILWMLGSALGRLVTLKVLLPSAKSAAYGSLFGLSFLRAALFWAALLAAAAALIFAGFANPGAPSLVVGAVLIAGVWLVWAALNWLLSLAAIFVVRDGEDTFGSIIGAVDFVRSAVGKIVLTSLPFVLLHYVAMAAAVAAGILIVDLMARVSPEAAWALLAIAAGYFAYADLLYITRLAAYVSLAGGETVVPATESLASPEPPSGANVQLPIASSPLPIADS